MTLKERIGIDASPRQIWPLLADPLRMAEWNPKLVRVNRRNAGPLRIGERFKAVFVLGKRERESGCEVIE